MRRSRNVRERNWLMAEQRGMEDVRLCTLRNMSRKESDNGDVLQL